MNTTPDRAAAPAPLAREPFHCTASTPWDLVTTPAIHESAHEIGEQEDGYPGGDIVTMRCPICLYHWRMELPQ